MKSELPASPAGGPEPDLLPVRIVSMLSHAGNQRVLADWIQNRERYEMVSTADAGLSGTDFDIGIFDDRSLREHGPEVRERKTEASAFLPVLLVRSAAAGDPPDTADHSGTERPVRRPVDDVLTTPIDTAELRGRLDTLARIRAQSVALKRKTEQLLLLNRITRHDIRNEMNVVSGWTEQLAAHTDDAGDQIRQRIVDSSQHVVDLTKAVREFVDTLQTAGDPDLRAVDLETVVTDELAKRRRTFDDAEFVVDGEVPQVHVRANDLLASVFRNLLNNAVQHNDSERPRVTVAVEARADTVDVTVADNGSGIPPDQGDAVLGRTERGLDHPAAGLGLYLVDTLVAQYGGAVRIGAADSGGASIDVEFRRENPTDLNAADNDS